MEPVKSYKFLSYDLKLYGFWPADLVVIFCVFVAVHWRFDNLFLDAVVVSPLLYVAWRAGKRSPRALISLVFFCYNSLKYPVAYRGDGPTYSSFKRRGQ